MIKVAVTGNIGGGKSTVSKIFKALGIPVFVADIEAKLLYDEEEVKQQLMETFGNKVFNKNGHIDNKALASVIFNDTAALKSINEIIHPLTLNKYHQWLEINRDKPYTLHESAILFENKLQHHFDKTINVTAPPELRIKRIMERDGITTTEVIARMKNQLTEEEKNKLADFVIINDGDSFLINQVLEIDKTLKSIK